MKLKNIMDEIASRLSNITVVNGYNTDAGETLVRGKTKIRSLPGCGLYLNSRTANESQNKRQKVNSEIVIEAVAEFTSDPETTAFNLLADIQKAIETTDTDLNGMLQGHLYWVSDQVIYPEADDKITGVQVTYSIPHIRVYGNADS